MDSEAGVKLEDLKSKCDEMKNAIEQTVSQFGDMEGKSQCEKGLYSAALATMNWLVIFSNTLMMTMKTSNEVLQTSRKSLVESEKVAAENAGGETKLKNESNTSNSKIGARKLSKSRTVSDMETRRNSHRRQSSTSSMKNTSSPKIQQDSVTANACLCNQKRGSRVSAGDERNMMRRTSKAQENIEGVSSEKRKSSGKKI